MFTHFDLVVLEIYSKEIIEYRVKVKNICNQQNLYKGQLLKTKSCLSRELYNFCYIFSIELYLVIESVTENTYR